ncbi:MAG: Asp-tRNA(Asn)/Glu-tRNA(Gln) amidotransferase subunit GatB [Oscillospiraceae bacterium]|nr:Asp-tRNA(Asn)/Glu-tRNA(Gln) amidotransferase subunit GatB [Oscillospiraceae bacterium]
MTWETVIGLEVHAELSTKSKIFCGCSGEFGGEPNSRVCPVCAGFPGALPKLNRAVVEYAARVGLALGCTVAPRCKFDRKNYFYPDLPKAYQVSQLYLPICQGGRLEIEADGQKKSIGIREIHMEEDAGKLVHDADGTFMDFNRCGVPLIEIVTLPDFRSGGEVMAFLERLREILLYLGVCDCKMQEGSLRVDVNLSVCRPGEGLGVRTEMKNLNSFKAAGRAVEYERRRQIELLESGGAVVQETRRWDDDAGESFGMRSKENAQDYRYFPEPDLLPVELDEARLAGIRQSLPELAHQKRARYRRDYALSEAEAAVLTGHKRISDLFESVARLSGEPAEAARLITGEIMRLMNLTDTQPENLSVDAGKLSALVAFVSSGKINRGAYKETAEAVFLRGVDPETYIAEKGLLMLTDGGAVAEAVKAAVEDNPDAARDYLAGKDKAFGFLVGQAMKKLGGNGSPDMVREHLRKCLTNTPNR